MKATELRPKYEWTCDECGAENDARMHERTLDPAVPEEWQCIVERVEEDLGRLQMSAGCVTDKDAVPSPDGAEPRIPVFPKSCKKLFRRVIRAYKGLPVKEYTLRSVPGQVECARCKAVWLTKFGKKVVSQFMDDDDLTAD
jgi:hypothetical protein